jgi:hypothetical protein
MASVSLIKPTRLAFDAECGLSFRCFRLVFARGCRTISNREMPQPQLQIPIGESRCCEASARNPRKPPSSVQVYEQTGQEVSRRTGLNDDYLHCALRACFAFPQDACVILNVPLD